jgi:hypothetical protein
MEPDDPASRRRDMGTRTRIAVLLSALALALAAAGCANGSRQQPGTPSPTPVNTSGCPTSLTIVPSDDAKTLCVAIGGKVSVDLSSPDGTRWLPIDVAGAGLSLTATPSGTPSGSPGSQSAILSATSAGTAQVTSAHAACPPNPGGVSCHSIVTWKVTVDVKS